MGAMRTTFAPPKITTAETSGTCCNAVNAWRNPIAIEINPNASAIFPNSFTQDGIFHAANNTPTKESVISDINMTPPS